MSLVKRKNPLMNLQCVAGALKKPPWMKIRLNPKNQKYAGVKELSRKLGIATVCEEALCPNIGECWGCGTATFMIMGDTCTRACKFCNVNHGKPRPLDPNEPKNLAEAIKQMGIDYAVITSVDRDDLDDLGAGHFAKCISELRKKCPKIGIEVLTPDFQGQTALIKKIIMAWPNVFAHNIEVVKRLQKSVRDFRASYEQSLFVLKYAKKIAPKIFTKSSIMVGLGENQKEVEETMRDLKKAGVDFLTIGQYLRPSAWNLEVKKYISPEQFAKYKKAGERMGFLYVASGPFVRSSYRAGEFFKML